MKKILFEDLELGKSGAGRTIKIFGSGTNGSVKIQVPDKDNFSHVYTLPETISEGVLKTDLTGKLEWIKCTSDYVLIHEQVDQVMLLDPVIPAGYLLTHIIVNNETNNSAQVTFSSTPTGTNIFKNFSIKKNGITARPACFIGSLTEETKIYANVVGDGDEFNNTVFDVYFVVKQII